MVPKYQLGYYTIKFQTKKRVAEFIDADGIVVGEGELIVGAVPSNPYLAKKKTSVDVKGPNLCQEVCVEVCLSVKVDLPGPWNPTFDVCIKIIVVFAK